MARFARIIVSLVAAAALAGAVVGGAAGSARSERATSAALTSQVLAGLNEIRAQHGLVPLKLSRPLTSAALQHANEMAHDGYFAHESKDGSAFWKRVQRFYGSGGFGLWSVGENLLWSSPDVDAAGAVKMWMESPEHRANILTPRWREVGLAAVHATAAPGTYHGLDVTIVAADFGVRK